MFLLSFLLSYFVVRIVKNLHSTQNRRIKFQGNFREKQSWDGIYHLKSPLPCMYKYCTTFSSTVICHFTKLQKPLNLVWTSELSEHIFIWNTFTDRHLGEKTHLGKYLPLPIPKQSILRCKNRFSYCKKKFHFRNLCLLKTSTSGIPEALISQENAVSGFGLLNCRRSFPGKQ